MKINKQIYYHILFWVVYSGIFTFVEGGYSNQFREAFLIELAFLPFRLVVTYLNFFMLLPLLIKKKFVPYTLYTVVSIILASFLHRYVMYNYINAIIFPGWEQGSFWQAYKFLQSAMIIVSPVVFLLGLTMMSRWVSTERRAEELQKEKLSAELSYLRSQINPHFFFNTLNNLYGLALEQSDKTPEVVLKLSELMSYILYEADHEYVPLTKEIDQIERYIRLEQIRYDNRFTANITTDGEIEKCQIAPLLLLPFVENSFKHGINKSSKGGVVSIFIGFDGNEITFLIKNSLPAVRPKDMPTNGGLGLENVKKRLELLFPNSHSLSFSENSEQFIVNLKIRPKKHSN